MERNFAKVVFEEAPQPSQNIPRQSTHRRIREATFGRNYLKNWRSENTTSHRFLRHMLGSCAVVQKTQLPIFFIIINMPSRINCIFGTWWKQRATLWATMHGRPYTPGTSYDESLDSAAKAMMSSGSGQERLRLDGPFTTLGCKCAGACMVNFPPS